MPSDMGISQINQFAIQASSGWGCQLETSPCGALSTDTLMTLFTGLSQWKGAMVHVDTSCPCGLSWLL